MKKNKLCKPHKPNNKYGEICSEETIINDLVDVIERLPKARMNKYFT